jgi:hypothetical protein
MSSVSRLALVRCLLWSGCLYVYDTLIAGPIPMMVGAELFRQGPRPRAMSLAGLANWLFTLILAISFELIQVSFLAVTFSPTDFFPLCRKPFRSTRSSFSWFS